MCTCSNYKNFWNGKKWILFVAIPHCKNALVLNKFSIQFTTRTEISTLEATPTTTVSSCFKTEAQITTGIYTCNQINARHTLHQTQLPLLKHLIYHTRIYTVHDSQMILIIIKPHNWKISFAVMILYIYTCKYSWKLEAVITSKENWTKQLKPKTYSEES